jgi:hypothetical protein
MEPAAAEPEHSGPPQLELVGGALKLRTRDEYLSYVKRTVTDERVAVAIADMAHRLATRAVYMVDKYRLRDEEAKVKAWLGAASKAIARDVHAAIWQYGEPQ